MHATKARLDEISNRYGEVLDLTPRVKDVLARMILADPLREEYARVGFVTVANVLPAESFTALVATLLPILSPVATNVVMPHTPTSAGTLSDGFRFSQVDADGTSDSAVRHKLGQLLCRLGLLDFTSALISQLTPLVRYIAGPVRFRRVYFYIYREGDYIAVHNDHQVGNRVDVQFPISFRTVAGVRVLANGHLEMHYDRAGSMNILGPTTWHDVPPILRATSGTDPVRFNMGFRFTPDG